MSRSTIKKMVTTDEVLQATDGGLDIFEKYLGISINPNKNISNPFITGDQNPSARIKPSKTSGIWTLRVYNKDGWTGSAISFVKRYFNLSFKEAMDKLCWDFNLGGKETNITPIIKKENKIIIPSEPILYEFESIPFQKKHHIYWNKGELTEDFLKQYDIFAAGKIAINKKVIKIPADEMCFVYVPDDPNEKGIKILRIGKNISKADKWRTNIPNTYLWGIYNMEKVDKLWVIKSRKDEMVAKLMNLDTISIQSENGVILDQNMPVIQPLANDIILAMGSDKQAVDMCKPVQQKYNTKYYNTPKNLLPSVNDLFSYVEYFGLKSLENHIKLKKL